MNSYDIAFVPSDERSHREVLEKIHAAWFRGERPPAQPRPVIRDSWLRLKRCGLNPVNQPAAVADRARELGVGTFPAWDAGRTVILGGDGRMEIDLEGAFSDDNTIGNKLSELDA